MKLDKSMLLGWRGTQTTGNATAVADLGNKSHVKAGSIKAGSIKTGSSKVGGVKLGLVKPT